jgi:hypothetical protein
MNDLFLELTGVSTEQDAMRGSINAAVSVRRGGKIYATGDNNERRAFKKQLAELIRKESERYMHPAGKIPDEQHCESIRRIIGNLSTRSKKCLFDEHLRWGIAQKAFNLYLKFLWRLGILRVPPPHCPVDRVVLRAAGIDGSWTKCDSEQQYMEWIEKLRARAGTLCLSEWEYKVWLDWALAQQRSKTACAKGRCTNVASASMTQPVGARSVVLEY